MRFKFGLKTIAIPLALLCMAAPVGTAILLAHRQVRHAQNDLILQYARETLDRSEQTADELMKVRDALNALPPNHRCDRTELDLMRELDLNSTLLQAVGFVKDDTLRCSSFSASQSIPLGKPAFVTSAGTKVWVNVAVSGPQLNFLVFAMNGAAGIVHRDMALSFVRRVPGLALASFNWSTRTPLVTRGAIDPDFIRGDLPDQIIFRKKGYLVAVVRSQHYDVGSIAMLPLAETSSLEAQAALVLLPIGLVTGVIFAVLMVYVVRSRLSLPSLIQQGLRRNEFSLVFHAGLELATGRPAGAEALLRWQRADGETVPPDLFIAAAEDAGMVRLLTERVFRLLIEAADDLRRLPPGFNIAVNLAADDLHAPATVDAIKALRDRAGEGFPGLIMETTERSLVDADQARKIIAEIRALGVRFAIDDFGTGYCSLSYLANLHVDYLKIDKLFVHALGTDSATGAVAGHIIEMAQDLKLRTVAEGIETEGQAAILRSLGVEFGQGWLFTAPLTARDLVTFVQAYWTAKESEAASATEPAV